jgi:hypothetical protein
MTVLYLGTPTPEQRKSCGFVNFKNLNISIKTSLTTVETVSNCLFAP